MKKDMLNKILVIGLLFLFIGVRDISNYSSSVSKIKQGLLQSGLVESMSITRIARGRLHR